MPSRDEMAGGAGQPEFFARDGVLYRRDGSGTRPLLALDPASAPPGVPVLPETWRPAPDVEFGVQASRFRHIEPSPSARWVAWETFSTHDLLGVVPAGGGSPTVLDFFFDSSAEDLSWAPGDRYLAADYASPSGYDEIRVYDAQAGSRLRAPWDVDCTPQRECATSIVEWQGPSTLIVQTEGGGPPRRFAVDVSRLPTR